MKGRSIIWSPASVTGAVAMAGAVTVFFIAPVLTVVILLSYVVLCITACFFPQMNFLGPVISRGSTGRKNVALTFDDGPFPSTTPKILALLDKYHVKATFFVSGVNAQKHPDLLADILRRGHGVGNHSLHHDPLIMLKGYRKLRLEVGRARDVICELGVDTLAFRPPVGIVNPGLFPILRSLGLFCITFSCRAFDAGNARLEHLAEKILRKVKADDIVLLHETPPRPPASAEVLMMEIERIISGIRDQGLTIVPLSELIGRPLFRMASAGGRGNCYPDDEQ